MFLVALSPGSIDDLDPHLFLRIITIGGYFRPEEAISSQLAPSKAGVFGKNIEEELFHRIPRPSGRAIEHSCRIFLYKDPKLMKSRGLSIKSKKALKELVGESAGTEIAELITQMANEIESLRRNSQSAIAAPVDTITTTVSNSGQTV